MEVKVFIHIVLHIFMKFLSDLTVRLDKKGSDPSDVQSDLEPHHELWKLDQNFKYLQVRRFRMNKRFLWTEL